jgi:Xaa-Pro dipeptidase
VSTRREPAFAEAEYRRRVAAVQVRMRERGLDGLVLFGPHNINYLTGMDSENLFDPQVCILPAGADPVLVILDFERGRFQNSSWLPTAIEFDGFADPALAFADTVKRHGLARGRIGIEQRALGHDQYRKLAAALPDAKLADGFGVVERLRLVKSEAEVALMREAAAITDKAFAAGFAAIADGRPDYEVAAAVTDGLYRNGSDLVCWGPIVAAGYRGGLAHSSHNGYRIRRGDTVFIEVTGQRKRYTAPLMRTAVLGKATEQQRRIADASAGAVAAILRAAKGGTPACDIAEAGLKPLAPVLDDVIFHHNFGYPVGIGYPASWIETLGFFLRANNREPVEPGMVFHLPMSLRVLGSFGIGLSHTMLVTPNGGVALTRSPVTLEEL